jgi:hypothetical protein
MWHTPAIERRVVTHTPVVGVRLTSHSQIFAAADKVDACQLEATIAKPPSYLTMDDELWFHNLIDHKLQESMRGVTFNTELRMPWETPVASALWGLLRMGIYDLGNGEGRWPGATRSQHYTAAVGHRLWFLLRTEQKAVSQSVHPACGITLIGL